MDGGVEWSHRLGWLREPSVPLLGCRRGVSSACWSMRGDYWLAGRYEKRVLDAVAEKSLGARLGLSERLVVFHRIPAPLGEYAVEVFADAVRIGVLEYAPGRGWLLYPSGAAASIAESLGAEAYEVTAPRGRRLKGKRIRLPRCPSTLYAVLRISGRWVAVAKPSSGGEEGCWAKVRDVAPRGFQPLEPAGLDEAVEANREALGALAAEAREWIRRVYRSVLGGQGRVYVALSGGADSSAVLSLAREALGEERVTAVYVDTGMEFPETRRHVERLAAMLGVELEVVEANRNPLEEVRRRGLMTRDNRWCTRLLKLEPLRRFYRRRGARLVLDGARSLESTGRAATPRLGENPLIPGILRALPIHHWSRLMVQLYLAERNIPLLHLYQEGLTRIGCIACPAMHLYELHIAYRLHPSWYHRLAQAAAEKTREPPGQVLARLLRGEWRKEQEASTGNPSTASPQGTRG